jgi:hypothetical protein
VLRLTLATLEPSSSNTTTTTNSDTVQDPLPEALCSEVIKLLEYVSITLDSTAAALVSSDNISSAKQAVAGSFDEFTHTCIVVPFAETLPLTLTSFYAALERKLPAALARYSDSDATTSSSTATTAAAADSSNSDSTAAAAAAAFDDDDAQATSVHTSVYGLLGSSTLQRSRSVSSMAAVPTRFGSKSTAAVHMRKRACAPLPLLGGSSSSSSSLARSRASSGSSLLTASAGDGSSSSSSGGVLTGSNSSSSSSSSYSQQQQTSLRRKLGKPAQVSQAQWQARAAAASQQQQQQQQQQLQQHAAPLSLLSKQPPGGMHAYSGAPGGRKRGVKRPLILERRASTGRLFVPESPCIETAKRARSAALLSVAESPPLQRHSMSATTGSLLFHGMSPVRALRNRVIMETPEKS